MEFTKSELVIMFLVWMGLSILMISVGLHRLISTYKMYKKIEEELRWTNEERP